MEKVLIFIFLCCMQQSFAEFKVQSLAELQSKGLVRQTYEESCGASSLATLLNILYDAHYSEQDFLEFLDNDTGMVNFNDLRLLAQRVNVIAKSYQINRELLEKITVPILVKIEDDPRFPHFVVIANHVGDFITIYDPNFGIYESLKSEFYSVWDKSNNGGYAIIVAPPQGFTSPKPIFPNAVFFGK